MVNSSGSTQPFSFYMNGTGTSPAPVISAPSVSSNGSNFMLAVSGDPGQTGHVLVSTNLLAGSWLVYTNFVQTAPTQIITLPIEPNYPKRFYRISLP